MARTKTKYPGVYERPIVSRKTGKPDVAYDINYRVNGKLFWHVAGTREDACNASVASRIRAQKIDEAEKGDLLPGKAMTFAEAWTLYLEKHLSGKPSAATDRANFELHLKAAIGHKPLNKITPLDIQSIKKAMATAPKPHQKTKNKQKLETQEREGGRREPYSAQTIKHVITLVGRVYRKCIAWGMYAGRIPTVGVELERPDNRRERYLTREEAQRLLDELKRRSPQWHDIALLSLNTGMRLDEILPLKAHQVDIGAGIIYAMDAKAGTGIVYLPEHIKPMLEARLNACAGPDSPVFAQGNGGHHNHISQTFVRVANELFNQGITDRRHRVVFHTLRHTYGSWLAQKGVSLYTIGELMRHASPEMTKRYAKLSPDSKRAAVKLLDD